MYQDLAATNSRSDTRQHPGLQREGGRGVEEERLSVRGACRKLIYFIGKSTSKEKWHRRQREKALRFC